MRRILKISCPDDAGLVARITGVLYRHGANIVENGEYVEPGSRRFFMRTAFDGDLDGDLLVRVLEAELPEGSEISMSDSRKKRVLLMATKEPHCLGDLLIRASFGDLPCEVTSVIANHDVLRKLSESFDLPFHLISHEGISREVHEEKVMAQIDAEKPDLIVMAKYMRILSTSFIQKYANQIVNIHHSFLPAFIGANPYRQAYERGVKIIGATAHFASEDLDEGPIIAQDVVPVNHTQGPQDMARTGRDVEKRVLARAVRYVLEDRVMVVDNKTLVFE